MFKTHIFTDYESGESVRPLYGDLTYPPPPISLIAAITAASRVHIDCWAIAGINQADSGGGRCLMEAFTGRLELMEDN